MGIENNKVEIPFLSELERHNSLIGRKKEIEYLEILIKKKNRSNVIIVGETGVGKTRLVSELSNKYKIMSLNINEIIAGTQLRGGFEKRIQILIDVCVKNKIIIFIDEIHAIYNLGKSEGGVSLLDILKPIIVDNKLSIIGCTTLNEFEILKKDKAFLRRFLKLKIKPISKKEINDNKSIIIGDFKKIWGYQIEENIIDEILEFCSKKNSENLMLDSFIDTIDTIYSIASINKDKTLSLDKLNSYFKIINSFEEIV